ncbi:SseB family protein [Micromonospora sp. URMC 103]|uniref:SseB family protein n=1 Tax=Micromonospora sp. URMC 103 TaxID=3423406 RepID=UPI003F1DF20D
MTPPSWPDIVARLRDTLARCDRDTDLELSAGPRGLRLLVRRDVVRALCPAYDEARLAALGWRRSTGGAAWWYETPRTPEQLDRLSLFVARTAAEVLTGDPAALSCRPVPPAPDAAAPAAGPAAVPAARTAADAGGATAAHAAGGADGGPASGRSAGPEPAAAASRTTEPEVTARLVAAAERRDLPGYLGLLAGATVCVPLAGDPTPDGDFPWTVVGDATGANLLPVFTSPDALTAFAGDGVPFVAMPCAELFADWPDPSWGLAVDPGSARAVALSAPALAGLLAANSVAE